MSFKTSTFAVALLGCCLVVTSVEAQLVKKIGNLPMISRVKQAGFFGGGGCDSCGVASVAGCDSCSAGAGCGSVCEDPSCGCAAPSCGLAGRILGGCLLGGPGGCGASIEPSCGSSGLGYSGGFGLCGASCDSCGDGGYFGRNLVKVNPCACGGSLVGDMARGFIGLLDRTMGATVSTVFGGLQRVTCHASGTFAALESVTSAACTSCGSAGCDGCGAGPAFGLSAADCGCDIVGACDSPACGVPTTLATPPNYGTVHSDGAAGGGYDSVPPAPTPAAIPADASGGATDPFLDDEAPAPQARVHRIYGTPTLASPRGVQATRTVPSDVRHSRYLRTSGRTVTLRR